MDGGTDKKKIEELKRLLAEERRASKKAIGKLQRELQKEKAQHPSSARDVRQNLLKEIDKERMMRLGTEQRLQDVQVESDSCRMRLHALQEEFRKMEEMVASMLQYKVKIDQLKQENSSMKSSYETNLQKYCSHISTLERDNMMLRNQVKKMEAQVLARLTGVGSKKEGNIKEPVHTVLHGKGDERDKSKLLLERLKMVEAENSSLVLENEQQRQQYEKCLDEIANQVVQALLAQKMLREECLKLQTRVQDLELQNKHLNIMFQQRLKLTSDSVLQVQHTSCFTTSHACQTSISANTTSASGATLSQEEMMALNFLGSAGSLQSMCSEIMGDDCPGKPQMSSPPPWLRDKMLAAGAEEDTRPSSTTSSTSTGSPPAPDGREHIVQTKIETEFPATNSSPRMKHISVYERRARSLERGICSFFNWARRSGRGGNRSRRGSDSHDNNYSPMERLKQSTSADAISQFDMQSSISTSQAQLIAGAIQWNKSSSQDRVAPQILIQSLPNDSSPAVLMVGADFNHKSFEAFNKSFEKLLAKTSCEDSSSSASKSVKEPAESISSAVITSASQKEPTVQPKPSQSSVLQRVLAQNRSSNSPAMRKPFMQHPKSFKPPGNASGQYYYYDYSDEDSDSRPVSRDFSMASTMSLNELLDSSAEGEVALDDDFFSDWSSVCISPKRRIDCLSSGLKMSNCVTESKNRSSSSRSRSVSSSPDTSGVQVSSSSITDIKTRQGKTTINVDVNQGLPESSSDVKTAEKQSSNKLISLVADTKEKECDTNSAVSIAVSQEAKPGNESNASEKTNCPEVSIQIHSDDTSHFFHPSPSPSPNLSQKSHDLGYASKGSYSQSSPSPSPSMPHRGTPLWLKSTKEPYPSSRNELSSLAVNKEKVGTGSRSTSKLVSPTQAPTLTRPGQLILVPQDNTFSFQGFSSASSTSSEDKSPLKIFESKQNSDMKSSVIEVKKDGTCVQRMRSLGDSSCETSSSLSASPTSPVKTLTKMPPPVAQKPTRIVKPEARPLLENAKDGLSKDMPKNFPGPETTNITVGFLLNDQLFPGQTHREVFEDFMKNKSLSGQPLDPSNHFLTKCQSSDSSFENLRVERSGSKDDGYSTMSSDIHPEMLEKFSDTLTRKLSANDSESNYGTVRNAIAVNPASQNEARRNSDPALHSHDRSFDLTSDPDSALETSIHSTAEMVNSSSSQVSTSSSDYPLSPCSTNVSKIARLFDGESTKLSFVHGISASSSVRSKDSTVPSSSKASSNSSSPGSPNAFVPSCCQPPESPRRLAIEFQKSVRSPGSPVVFRKLSPGSPKDLNKSFSGILHHPVKQQLSLNQSSSGLPEISSAKKLSVTKLPDPAKPPVNRTSSPSGSKYLPKGFYSSAVHNLKNGSKSLILSRTKTDETSDMSNVAFSKSECAGVKSETSVHSASSDKENHAASPVITSDLKLTSSPTAYANFNPIDTGKILSVNNLALNDNNAQLSEYPSKSSAFSTSNRDTSKASDFNKGTQVQEQNLQTSIVTSTKIKSCSDQPGVSDVSSKMLQCNGIDICVSGSKNVASSDSDFGISTEHSNVNTNSRSNYVHIDYIPLQSSFSNGGVCAIHDSSSFSSVIVNTESSFSHSQLHCQCTPSSATEGHVQPVVSTDQLPKQSSRIIMTNQGFQQFSSDSENNDDDDDSSSLPSITFDDNFLEDIPEENDNGDNYVINNFRDFNSNIKNSNSTTNSVIVQINQQPIGSTTSEQIFRASSEMKNSTCTSTMTNEPPTILSSSDIRQHVHQSQFCSTEHPSQPFSAPQQMGQNAISIVSNKNKCLRRSKSESNLCNNKSMSTSSYDDFFGLAWNSGKVLERSVSVSEIDLLLHRSRQLDITQGQRQHLKTPNNEADHHNELTSSNHTRRQYEFLPQPPIPPLKGFSSHQNYHHQMQHSQHQYHLHHPPQHFNNQYHHNSPWIQTLQLDLSDVTELDEDGSELATTHDSLNSSHLDMVNDESPSCDVDEQKRFNSQFYSLCKVDSSRSLLSSGNDSKDRLSLTSLNEINNRSFDKAGDSPIKMTDNELNNKADNYDEENEIAIREFDEISRQIASLSETVDHLNQSLSSLNSGEFEPSSHRHIESSPFKSPVSKKRAGIIDDYHWVDDEFFLTSCGGGEIIIGSSDLICGDSFGEIFTHSSSFDLNSTEDATSEFYQVPLSDHSNPFAHRNSAEQDYIFEGAFFDIAKDKPSARKSEQLVIPRCGSDGNLKDKSFVAQKRLSVPTFYQGRNVGDAEMESDEKDVMEEEKTARLVTTGQEEDKIDRLNGSNNDSDDSLASDIGLDHMMCQRLFGRKGHFQPSSGQSKPFKDFRQFVMRYGDSEKEAVSAFDFLDSLSFSESGQKQRSERGICSQEGGKLTAEEVLNSNEENRICDDTSSSSFVLQQETCSKEMKDVGVDAMSQSQQSMNASFETFDQSLPGLDTTEVMFKTLHQPPSRCGSYSLSEVSLNQSFGNYENKIKKDCEKNHRNTFDPSVTSTFEIVAQGECDLSECRPRCHSLKDQTGHRGINSMASVMTYSDFVADFKQTSMINSEVPPKLPPRRPVISNYSTDQDIAPLPPPPPCLNNETFYPVYNNQNKENQHYKKGQQPHMPYVNQVVPVLGFQKSRNFSSSRPLSDPIATVLPQVKSGTTPPPIPPRQPQISRTQDGRPQVLIRPHRIHQDNKPDGRPHSFNHYIINKSKPALPSLSSPANLATYPRSRSHSETSALSKRTPLEKPKDEITASKIPRRKLKTRRERSQLKQNTEKPSLDATVKLANTSGNISHNQWRDINVVNGTPVSESSCEDNISS